MKRVFIFTIIIIVAMALMAATGCVTETPDHAPPVPPPSNSRSNAPPVATDEIPVTLPLIDALFFSDENFAADLKRDLQLTDEHVSHLRRIAREETIKLGESDKPDQSDYQGSTAAAAELARRRVTEAIGEEKWRQLSAYVLKRWREEGTAGATLPSAPASLFAPSDTRIIVNAPAYRMDVFENGQLIKSYKVGIGYPEFPLPAGMRRATNIIFNPTWTPPDEPWVRSSGKVKAGESIKAGSKLNPLGVIKIPIGLPSLIHGGKAPSKLGGFASHGCVGMTDEQVQDFAKVLARLGGVELTDVEIAEYEKKRTETRSVKLNNPVPVELRYETIVVEDGALHIYRDVYERGTNTEENLRAALEAYGVTIDQLSDEERAEVEQSLAAMSRSPGGQIVTGREKDPKKRQSRKGGKVTRAVKGQKEIVIEIAALASKGYPAPFEMDAGIDKQGAAMKSHAPPKKR